ncbi:MAG: TetR/AcrR family transcriptional regulator [Gemmatimonadetes bacterium]|nr:TetR/AcrR family transcriptional regulator [Gemmatimonadota bacterium]
MDQQDILKRACELYVTGGSEAVSMRRLASDLGVTAPALYRHYASKEQILLDVVMVAFGLFTSYLTQALTGQTAAERLYLSGKGHLDFALQHPMLYEMLFIPAHALGVEEFPEQIKSRLASLSQFYDDRVRECMEAGLLQAQDPHEVSLTLWGHAHGMVSIYLRGCHPMDEEQFRAAYWASCGRVMQGIATADYATAMHEVTEHADITPRPPAPQPTVTT